MVVIEPPRDLALHHAAFDANLIGINPDYRIHVAPALLEQDDGPMLEQGLKQLAGTMLRRPHREGDWPDRDRLAQWFELFTAASTRGVH